MRKVLPLTQGETLNLICGNALFNLEIAQIMNLAVLCDFDGTVTTVDTAEWILTKFSQVDWQKLDRQFEKGKITLEECLNKEFSSVNASKELILKELRTIVTFRPNFKKLCEFCKRNDIPFVIASAGLDFVIEYFLKTNDCFDLVEVCTAKIKFVPGGIRFTFPKPYYNASDNLKDDMVKHYQAQSMKVIYVGDGFADFSAARNADYTFAIENSRLAKLCKSHRIPCKTITDFKEIVQAIRIIDADFQKAIQ